MTDRSVREFAVVAGETIFDVLDDRRVELIDLVERAYVLHGSGETTNPTSHFLRFPDKPSARIIALPAAVRGDVGVDGLKWVSSYPDNIARGIPRASAVLLLNDAVTGYPYACLEGSIISAARTAASAAVAVRHLAGRRAPIGSVGFFGAGLIARYLHGYLTALGLATSEVAVFDLDSGSAASFADHVRTSTPGASVGIRDSAEDLVRSSDLVVFATTAATPHVHDPAWFAHHPLVLHVSLRDLDPSVILASTNVVDDVDHVLRAETSLHLAEQQSGHRDFIDGTLFDAISGRLDIRDDRPLVFSPFGLGMLDVVVGDFVYRRAAETGRLHTVDNFFFDLNRHHPPRNGDGQ